jgi:hypothetical protein
MAWIAGYHDTAGNCHDHIRETWAEARAVMVDELDQRLMAAQDEASRIGSHEIDTENLEVALQTFLALEPDEEGAADACGLTFVLVPESVRVARSIIALHASLVVRELVS